MDFSSETMPEDNGAKYLKVLKEVKDESGFLVKL